MIAYPASECTECHRTQQSERARAGCVDDPARRQHKPTHPRSELLQAGSELTPDPASSSHSPLAVMNGGDGSATGVDDGHNNMYPLPPPPPMSLPRPHGHAHAHQQRPANDNDWAGNDANTLLVVATLITTLRYQLGSSIPGGYWQDTQPAETGKPPHTAGDPVMRDLHPERYWVFMVASWMGFAGSMLMTLSLLVRMPVDSRHVRWSFAVAYASLPKTHIALDIFIWVAVTAFLWLMISVRAEHRARVVRFFCCAGDN
ncbi:hypothetical protein HU200_044485 [Digitaria exilis]|uniref:PGG domain-containing protein n=1 Tax=Digitaria exilis TaxID=1010633 RepID=A0A835AYG2_9POAL|nr:hypothetical protein HU200_044485 [Digitaria exilis]